MRQDVSSSSNRNKDKTSLSRLPRLKSWSMGFFFRFYGGPARPHTVGQKQTKVSLWRTLSLTWSPWQTPSQMFLIDRPSLARRWLPSGPNRSFMRDFTRAGREESLATAHRPNQREVSGPAAVAPPWWKKWVAGAHDCGRKRVAGPTV